MKVMTTNCIRCKSPLELVLPEEVLRVIKKEAFFNHTCMCCSAKLRIKVIFPTPNGNSNISDSKSDLTDSESDLTDSGLKKFDPLGPRPQISEIVYIS